MSTKKSSQREPSEITALLSLPGIEPPSPLQFPTFQQLVESDRESQLSTPASSTRRLNDLFDGTLGDLSPLLADYQEHPEKYGQEVHELFEQLILGSTSLERLSSNERRLLNLATFDFHQVLPPKPAEPIVKQAEAELDGEPDGVLEDEERVLVDAEKPEAPIPGVDVPVTELPAYWWLR